MPLLLDVLSVLNVLTVVECIIAQRHTHRDSDVTLGSYENGTGGESDGEKKLTHFSHRKYSAFEGVGL